MSDDFDGPRKFIDNSTRNLAIWRDAQPPDYCASHVALIDALRDYIRADDAITGDLVREDAVTPAQVRANNARMQRYRLLLRELEDHEFNPSLHGFLKLG
jgi:hypothetical protein